MGENVLHGRNTVFGFVYFVYLYFFLGVFQKHFLIILIIQKGDIAPLVFINDIVKNINDISEFSKYIFSYIKILPILKFLTKSL